MWACGHHTGVDFLAPIGTPVHSATAGTVIEASNGGGWGDAYGLHVVVSSQIGDVEYRILYAHLDTRLVRSVTSSRLATSWGGPDGRATCPGRTSTSRSASPHSDTDPTSTLTSPSSSASRRRAS